MTKEDLAHARARLEPYLTPTPLVPSPAISHRVGKNVWLKLETQNPTGSFKVRPAFNGMLAHLDEAKKRGVLASSSGNFAQAVAFAAKILGVNATIVMPSSTNPLKI